MSSSALGKCRTQSRSTPCRSACHAKGLAAAVSSEIALAAFICFFSAGMVEVEDADPHRTSTSQEHEPAPTGREITAEIHSPDGLADPCEGRLGEYLVECLGALADLVGILARLVE